MRGSPRPLSTVAAAPALAAGLLACGGASGPTPFLLEETIPLGAFELEVVDFEPVPTPPPMPLNTLRAQPGDRVVVTFVEWDGLDGLAEPDRFRFVETFLEDRLTLVDGDGNEYRSLSAMTRPMYASGDTRGMLGGTVPKDWVAVFHVLEDATTFTLLVEHPDPREGEPELARVEVGTLDAP